MSNVISDQSDEGIEKYIAERIAQYPLSMPQHDAYLSLEKEIREWIERFDRTIVLAIAEDKVDRVIGLEKSRAYARRMLEFTQKAKDL
jgi:hypothetical protein